MNPQGSSEWRAERCGRVTASRIADLMARTKTGYGASRANYMAELLCERLTGVPAERFVNDPMRWGTEQEPAAKIAYEFLFNATIEPAGFIPHPLIEMAGASPDGYVGSHGLVEFKAPNTATHVETLLSGAIPDKYVKQCQFQMACTGRHWVDFGSFDPRVPASMQLWVKRIERDAKFIGDIEDEVRAFIKELDAKIHELRSLYGDKEAA